MKDELKKPAGWFSRRHHTDTAHVEARNRYKNRACQRPPQKWDPTSKKWEKTVV